MIILRLIIIFVLFSINLGHAHYFSESFSKWNISNQDIQVNFQFIRVRSNTYS